LFHTYVHYRTGDRSKATLFMRKTPQATSPVASIFPNARALWDDSAFEELCNRVASKSGLAVSTVKYALECQNQKLIDLLSQNARVHTGLYVASLGIGGSVSSIGEQPNKVDNPVHAVLTPEGDIVDQLKAIDVQNITATVNAVLNEFQQVGCLEMNKIVDATNNIVVNGRNIFIDSTKTDEGAFLMDRITGQIKATATIVETDSARLVCTFATLPANGVYQFVIATRNGDPTMDVTQATRLVTVEQE